jgi:GTPase SAR1 family protein
LSQFVDKTFSGTYTKTIGVGFWKKTVDVRGQKVKLEIWEISGN